MSANTLLAENHLDDDRRRRKVCVVLVDRANYGRLKPVMQAIHEQPELELQVLATGTMVLERFDQPVNVVREDGFHVDGEIYIELEGSTPTTMAKCVGFGLVEFASEFHRLKPDLVLLIGDRYEALAAAIAAAYMNITLVHIQGGEVSGSIDESRPARDHQVRPLPFSLDQPRGRVSDPHGRAARHDSRHWLPQQRHRPHADRATGQPRSSMRRGAGIEIDVTKPFLLVVFHPTTTEFGGERAADGGAASRRSIASNANAAAVAQYRRRVGPHQQGDPRVSHGGRAAWMRTLTNLTPENYLKVLANAACAVGNSSSFVRDAGYFGTPVVLVGNRQNGRETDEHVIRVPVELETIVDTITKQLAHGRYAPSTLYGDGHVSERIAAGIAGLKPYLQKQLAFTLEEK